MLMNNGRNAGTTSILSLKTGSRAGTMPAGPKGEKRPADVWHCCCLLLGRLPAKGRVNRGLNRAN
jgi:hypothetical protein